MPGRTERFIMVGIMQGRLVPPEPDRFQAFPRERWRDEFAFAAAAGLESIEWIFDAYGESANPLGSEAGIRELRELQAQHRVAVRSLCADYFMDYPLVRATDVERRERLAKLEWLLRQCRTAGIGRVVLPFVDQSDITNAADEQVVAESLQTVLPAAERLEVELHLETALGPEAFRRFLQRLPHPLVNVNYDSGNSASLGYDPREEFAAYGERIGSFHVKDRLRGGGTVPLGTGDADLPAVFDGLRRLGFRGDVILQVARDVPGDEVAWAVRNRETVVAMFQASGWQETE